jgi:hypothetical protein
VLQHERSNTSAERSEARENDVGRSATFRVASPLVMATRSSHQSEQIAKQVASTPIRAWRVVGTCQPSHYLLLRKGVVPHETTSDSHVVHSGFAPLRLRRGARSPHACHTMKRALRKPQGACVSSLCLASCERADRTPLGPRGFTPREADESSQKRRTRRSRPAASCERSNYDASARGCAPS